MLNRKKGRNKRCQSKEIFLSKRDHIYVIFNRGFFLFQVYIDSNSSVTKETYEWTCMFLACISSCSLFWIPIIQENLTSYRMRYGFPRKRRSSTIFSKFTIERSELNMLFNNYSNALGKSHWTQFYMVMHKGIWKFSTKTKGILTNNLKNWLRNLHHKPRLEVKNKYQYISKWKWYKLSYNNQ